MLDSGGFVFLGYCAKQTYVWEGRELASVSACISERPHGWMERWDFNRSTCWDTEAAALACIGDPARGDFRVFAYRVLPLIFDDSGEGKPIEIDRLFPRELPPLPAGAPPAHYRTLGYDVVERAIGMGTLGFGCSPLSCNGMAGETAVNPFCLLDEVDAALAAARRFGVEQPEPGPYVIVEVLAAISGI